MHPLAILSLLFTSTTLAVSTTSRVASPSLTPKLAAPRALSPSNPPTTLDVKNSITNWETSVNTVNDYLNNPNNSTKLQSAIVYAKDEPVQLATLMKVRGLSAAGVNSGRILMGNFPSIVSNLNSIQTGAMSTQDATAAVNFDRCCTVLPAIGSLWAAAANATKAGVMVMPKLEAQCSQMSCASGVSGTSPNNTKLVMH